MCYLVMLGVTCHVCSVSTLICKERGGGGGGGDGGGESGGGGGLEQLPWLKSEYDHLPSFKESLDRDWKALIVF